MRYINRYIAKKSHHVGSTEVHRDTTNNAGRPISQASKPRREDIAKISRRRWMPSLGTGVRQRRKRPCRKATPSAPWSNGASQQWLRTSFGHINQRLDEIAESIASNNEAQAVIAHHQPLLLDELKKLNLAISQQEWIYNVDLRNYNWRALMGISRYKHGI